ncbi:hypothetical protein Ssi03_52720 [Sphaerisporangium siamense]|uniref:Preprotein translocase subunit SecG n=1 Tax=Sphaerisporangium siamense TaxID=795645 RepID=A0A7W7GAE8_9ACTN|nr:hypothetical protein [Sphaerisporangium siamense]MBB4701349.1 preprotein translocase subunit SecG [Sphaerisporangium siamense]GII87282.1 hypothetical protein Ssi03_52720 [Sphaerisporangium siamense]
MLAVREFTVGDVTALTIVGLFIVVCLVLAVLENRDAPDTPEDDRDGLEW